MCKPVKLSNKVSQIIMSTAHNSEQPSKHGNFEEPSFHPELNKKSLEIVRRDPHRKSSVVEQLYQSLRSSERNATKLLTKYKSNECTPERPSLLRAE
jgi:hypothetical protein